MESPLVSKQQNKHGYSCAHAALKISMGTLKPNYYTHHGYHANHLIENLQ